MQLLHHFISTVFDAKSSLKIAIYQRKKIESVLRKFEKKSSILTYN